MKILLCFITLLLAINANAATYFFNRFTTNAEPSVGNMTLSGLSVTGATPGLIRMFDADNSNLIAWAVPINVINSYTNLLPVAPGVGLWYVDNVAGVMTWSYVTVGSGLTVAGGLLATNGQTVSGGNQTPITSDINYAQWSQTNILNISGGFTPQIRFSTNNLTVGFGKIPDNYGAGGIDTAGYANIGTDVAAGGALLSGSSSYHAIGNRTAWRADGNGQLRIFAANVSTAGGPGADVFLGTTTATNGFITVTNSAQTLSAITFPATTVKWTNNFGMNILLYIDNSGVTGTSVSKNNQQIFSSLVGDMTIGLKPGDYFAVAYTIGTPVARWEPQ